MTTLASPGEFLAEIRSARLRREEGVDLAEEAAALRADFRSFVYAGAPVVLPRPLVDTWHIGTLCEHIQYAYEREIPRLVVTIQPGSLKSTLLSVMAPAWRWTHRPQERLVTASHTGALANRDARKSRELMQSRWYQARFGDAFGFTRDENLKQRYSNDRSGHRVTTHVGGGTGDRGAILQLDDPHNAQDASSETKARLGAAVEWWGGTWVSRMDDLVDDPGAIIVIGQRIHEDDLIGHLLEQGDWTHLCLPTYYEPKHPVIRGAYPATVTLDSGRVIQGDPRTHADELLAPTVQTREMLERKVRKDGITAHVFAGQYQQRPAPKEGNLLKRAGWRYYDPELSFYRSFATGETFGPEHVEELAARVGAFAYLCHSWDTSLKDRAHSDFVAGQVWGVNGASRFLLRLYHQRAGLNETVEAMLELSRWALELWPDVGHFVVVEAQANGKDAAAAIRKRVQGVVVASAIGSKQVRAGAASPALDGGNCWLPGYVNEDGSNYDERTPTDVQVFVEELSVFDQGVHDDQVDAWSSMVNWTRKREVASEIETYVGVEMPRSNRLPTG